MSRRIPATLWKTSPSHVKCKGRKLGKCSGIARFQTNPAFAFVKGGSYKSYLPSFWKRQSRKLSRKHRRMFLLITRSSNTHSLPEVMSHVTYQAGNKKQRPRFIGHLSTRGSRGSSQGWDYIMPELFKGWRAKTTIGAASVTPQVLLWVTRSSVDPKRQAPSLPDAIRGKQKWDTAGTIRVSLPTLPVQATQGGMPSALGELFGCNLEQDL